MNFGFFGSVHPSYLPDVPVDKRPFVRQIAPSVHLHFRGTDFAGPIRIIRSAILLIIVSPMRLIKIGIRHLRHYVGRHGDPLIIADGA
jgi:hypothetical protein